MVGLVTLPFQRIFMVIASLLLVVTREILLTSMELAPKVIQYEMVSWGGKKNKIKVNRDEAIGVAQFTYHFRDLELRNPLF